MKEIRYFHTFHVIIFSQTTKRQGHLKRQRRIPMGKDSFFVVFIFAKKLPNLLPVQLLPNIISLRILQKFLMRKIQELSIKFHKKDGNKLTK